MYILFSTFAAIVLAVSSPTSAPAAFSASDCQISQAEPICVCVNVKGKHGKTFECDDPKLGPKCTEKGGAIKHVLIGDDPTNPFTITCGQADDLCTAPLECPAPSDANHQTICGQLFDLEDGSRFDAVDAAGTECTTPTSDGPCSLNIRAYDGVVYGADPAAATPLTADPIYIDDCGRYRLTDVAIPSGPFIALAIDDADGTKQGPTGSTNAVAVNTPKQGGAATSNLDGWIASEATTDLWEASGGPPVSGGLFVPIFYEAIATTNRDLQDGVTVTASGSAVPARDDYFVASESARQTIDPAAIATGANGTALVTGASIGEALIYSGSGGGLSSSCQWETHGGASLAGILWVQGFRPENVIGQTCDR